MAKKVPKKIAVGKWQMSWKSLFFAASVTLNIAFVVVFCMMIFTNKLDGMFITEGLSRYCSTANDVVYSDSDDNVKALREFTCAKGDAQPYFDNAFKTYKVTEGVTTE